MIEEKSVLEKKKVEDDIIEYEKLLFDGNNIFIDYFLEIGIKPEIFKNGDLFNKTNDELNEIIKPEIICKFPNIDQKIIQINNEIINHIFPNGYKIIKSLEKPNQINFSLILDNRFYSAIYPYKYFTCSIIYENINQYKELFNCQKDNINIENNLNEENIFIPKCICFVSKHPYFIYFNNILNILINIFEEKLKSKVDFLLDKIIQHIIIQTPEIPRGLRKINLQIIKDININIEEHKMTEASLINFDIKKYIKFFSSQNIIEILTYILLETKMIFFSSNIENLTYVIMLFLNMIFPFKYQYQIISILYKEKFHYLNNKSPFIYGINESFNENFLQNNNLNIKDAIILIDIDNGLFNTKNLENDIPQIPISLRNKLEENLKKVKNDSFGSCQKINEIFREIFLTFMIGLLENYSKYLIKDTDINIGVKLSSMINIDLYLNSLNSDNEFYSKLFDTQMFYDFIYKKLIPKNIPEKMDILFFDEKIKEKTKKTIFSKPKPNILLNSKDYDFKETIEIKNDIQLTESDVNFFNNKNNIEKCISHGFIFSKNENNNSFEYTYYIFPILLINELFLNNCKNFRKTLNYSQEIEELNSSIINRSNLSFSDVKKISEMEDYIYSCWIITWGLTFWYNDENEKKFRFYQFIDILKKKVSFNMKILQMCFKEIVNCKEDDLALFLYQEIINYRLEPTWEIFTIISEIIKKKNY